MKKLVCVVLLIATMIAIPLAASATDNPPGKVYWVEDVHPAGGGVDTDQSWIRILHEYDISSGTYKDYPIPVGWDLIEPDADEDGVLFARSALHPRTDNRYEVDILRWKAGESETLVKSLRLDYYDRVLAFKKDTIYYLNVGSTPGGTLPGGLSFSSRTTYGVLSRGKEGFNFCYIVHVGECYTDISDGGNIFSGFGPDSEQEVLAVDQPRYGSSCIKKYPLHANPDNAESYGNFAFLAWLDENRILLSARQTSNMPKVELYYDGQYCDWYDDCEECLECGQYRGSDNECPTSSISCILVYDLRAQQYSPLLDEKGNRIEFKDRALRSGYMKQGSDKMVLICSYDNPITGIYPINETDSITLLSLKTGERKDIAIFGNEPLNDDEIGYLWKCAIAEFGKPLTEEDWKYDEEQGCCVWQERLSIDERQQKAVILASRPLDSTVPGQFSALYSESSPFGPVYD